MLAQEIPRPLQPLGELLLVAREFRREVLHRAAGEETDQDNGSHHGDHDDRDRRPYGQSFSLKSYNDRRGDQGGVQGEQERHDEGLRFLHGGDHQNERDHAEQKLSAPPGVARVAHG